MKKKAEQNNINLEELAGGAFAEKVNEALMQVAENIQNPNTEATAKRGITVSIKFSPNKNRQLVNTSIAVQTKLAATEAIDTQIIMGKNFKTGEIEFAEYDGQMRGQISFSELEEEEPEPEEEPTVQEPEEKQSGKPLDLINRGKKNSDVGELAASGLIAGKDFDPDTGELYGKDSKIVSINRKVKNA